MSDHEADAMQTDPRIAALERRLQEAEQRRHQSQDALTMRIAALEQKIERLEADLFEDEEEGKADEPVEIKVFGGAFEPNAALAKMTQHIVDTRELFAYGVLRTLREPAAPDLQYRRLLPSPIYPHDSALPGVKCGWKDVVIASVPFVSAPMSQHQDKRSHIAPIGYIADHFNEPDPTQPAGPGRRIGWLYVADDLMGQPDLMERLLAGGTVLRRKRRGTDEYGLLLERVDFEPYEGDEDSAPIYSATLYTDGQMEWRRA